MKLMRNSSNLKIRASTLWFTLALIGATSENALAENAVSLDHGDQLIVPYHWKIEHRARSPIDIFVHQLGTPEGRKILGTIASIFGVNPTIATVVTANIPLPHLDAGATDNEGLLAAPNEMVICKCPSGMFSG